LRWPSRRRAAHGGCVDTATITVVCDSIQLQVVQYRTHAGYTHAFATRAIHCLRIKRRGIFDLENGLVEREEVGVGLAFAELCALLVDGEIYERGHVVEYVKAVFKADFHVVLCGFGLHPAHVVDRVGVFEIETVVVLLGVVSSLMTEKG
jgi:hypothetical protein